VLSGYNIAYAAALLTAGRLADRLGRRRIYLTGLVVFVVASGLCGLAPSVPLLIGARVLQACGGALLTPASLALVLPEFPIERRSAAIGVWSAVGGLAAGTGPTIGSLLIEGFGWRWIFLINVVIGAVAVVLGARVLTESKDPAAASRSDVVGALAGVLGVGAIALALTKGNEWGYLGPRTLVAYGAFAVLLPLFVWRCARHRNPVLDLSLVRERSFSVGNAALFCYSMAFFGMFFTNVRFLQQVWGYSVLRSGLAITPGPLAAAFTAPFAGRWADRIGHRRMGVPGPLLFAASVIAVAVVAPSEPSYWTRFFPFFIVTGVGVGLSITILNSASQKYLPPNRFAMGSAFSATVRQLGTALGVALSVALVTRSLPSGGGNAVVSARALLQDYRTTWWVLGTLSLLAALLMATSYRPPHLAAVAAARPARAAS
jgi:EmrB/QacA subfamily drug resistance transporter